MATIFLPGVCANRPGTAFRIPCFYEEFPVVRAAKNTATWGIPCISMGNLEKNTA